MLDNIVERRREVVRVFAAQGIIQLPPPIFERSAFFIRTSRSVAEVVSNTEKGVQDAHGPALWAGENAKGVIEVPRLAPRQLLAVGVREGEGWIHGTNSDGDSTQPLAQALPQGADEQLSLVPFAQDGSALPDIVAGTFDLAKHGEPAADKQANVGAQARFHEPA